MLDNQFVNQNPMIDVDFLAVIGGNSEIRNTWLLKAEHPIPDLV